MPGWSSPPAVVVAWLNQCASGAGETVRAFGVVPSPRPSRFIRVMRGGTTTTSVARREVRLTVECWDSSGVLAADQLGDMVADWLSGMDSDNSHIPAGADGFFGGPYSQPDPDSGCPRSVMTVNLRQRRS